MHPESSQPLLTVAIVAHCDADLLVSTIERIDDVDHIVVVDTDANPEAVLAAANDQRVQVVKHAWGDDFAAARNAGMAACTGDWVLWLEPGEVISSDDFSTIRRQIQECSSEVGAVMLLVRRPLQEGAIAADQIGEVRLMRRSDQIQFQHRLRSTVLPSLEAANLQLEGLPSVIHRGELEEPDRAKTRARLEMWLADIEIKTAGPLPQWLLCLGDAFQTLADMVTAERFYRRTLSESPTDSPEYLAAIYGLLSTLDLTGAPRSEQLALCSQGLATFPLDMQLLCALGGYLQSESHFEHADRAYRLAYEYGQLNPYLWHVVDLREIAANCLAIVLQLQKQDDQAATFLEQAVADSPNSLRLRRQLLEVYVKEGRLDDAMKHVNSDEANWPAPSALRSTVRGTCLAVQENWVAAAANLEAPYNTGYRDPLCLRFLVRSLMESGRKEDALVVLQEWRREGGLPTAAAQLLSRIEPPAEAQRAQSPSKKNLRVDAAQEHKSTTAQTSSAPHEI